MFKQSFDSRSDISLALKSGLSCDAIIIVGSISKQLEAARKVHKALVPTKPRNGLLEIYGGDDIEVEKPGKIAEAILLFSQGLGLLSSVSLASCQSPTNGPKVVKQCSCYYTPILS